MFHSCWRVESCRRRNYPPINYFESIYENNPEKFIQPKIIHDLMEYSFNLRSVPVFMLSLEIFSKLLILLLIGFVTIRVYGAKEGPNYPLKGAPDDRGKVVGSEVFLFILLCTQMLHKYGEYLEQRIGLAFFREEWNAIDFITYGMGIIWFFGILANGYFTEARVLLALSAIPASLGLLRYMSMVSKSLGELVIMIRVMVQDLISFAIVYVVAVCGFFIAYRGLFYGSFDFHTNSATFFQIFLLALANVDTSILDSNSEVVNGIGQVLILILLLFTAIILMNLF
jgi:hypothetical protein